MAKEKKIKEPKEKKVKEKKVKERKIVKESNGNTKKVVLFVVLIIVIMTLVTIALIALLNDGEKPVEAPEAPKVQISALDQYGYTLDDRDTELFKAEFEKLKENLDSENVNYEEYAKSLAKLFIIDLYTLNNKINKYDVGGVEYVYPAALDNYKLNVEDTIYRYVEDNAKGKRNQTLPEVASIEITAFNTTSFNYKPDFDKNINNKMDGYSVKYNVTYVTDLGYDKSGEVIIVKEENKLYVIEKK